MTIYGDGEQTRDFVNVRDVAVANVLAMEASVKSACYNIGSRRATTINELAKVMQDISGIKARTQHAEPRKVETRHSVASIDVARSGLMYSPNTSLREGLSEYFNWLCSVRYKARVN